MVYITMCEYPLVQHRNMYRPKTVISQGSRMSFRGCSVNALPDSKRCTNNYLPPSTANTGSRLFGDTEYIHPEAGVRGRRGRHLPCVPQRGGTAGKKLQGWRKQRNLKKLAFLTKHGEKLGQDCWQRYIKLTFSPAPNAEGKCLS